MARFTDRQGREWVLDLSVQDLKTVRSELDLNLFDAFADNYRSYNDLVSNPERLVAVVYLLCQRQAQVAGVSPEDFGAAIAGDVLASLGDAFTEALIDFFPNARGREVLRATVQKAREVMDEKLRLEAEALQALQ
ncbi:MAG: hypothetical protein WCI73_14045, partial [Phycisphaerae bacterium]